MKVANGASEGAFSGQTVPLDVVGSASTKDAVVAYSNSQYGTPIATIQAYLDQLFTITTTKQAATKRTPAKVKQTNMRVV